VTKTNTSTADTFRTPELGFLGYMQGNKPYFYRQSTRRHTLTNSSPGPQFLRTRLKKQSENISHIPALLELIDIAYFVADVDVGRDFIRTIPSGARMPIQTISNYRDEH
jgi:hypothetical protein